MEVVLLGLKSAYSFSWSFPCSLRVAPCGSGYSRNVRGKSSSKVQSSGLLESDIDELMMVKSDQMQYGQLFSIPPESNPGQGLDNLLEEFADLYLKAEDLLYSASLQLEDVHTLKMQAVDLD